MKVFTTWYVVFVCLLVLGAGTLFTWGYLSRDPVEEVKYPTLFVHPQGVMSPTLVAGDDVDLNDDEPVFGIVVNGQARAYQKYAFTISEPRHQLGRHVVNDLVGQQPVTIVHCDRIDCTRVFLGTPADNPLKVAVKGWDTDKGMILVIDGSPYPLESSDIPLKKLNFMETSWAAWREAHPDTSVYLDSSSQIVNVN